MLEFPRGNIHHVQYQSIFPAARDNIVTFDVLTSAGYPILNFIHLFPLRSSCHKTAAQEITNKADLKSPEAAGCSPSKAELLLPPLNLPNVFACNVALQN